MNPQQLFDKRRVAAMPLIQMIALALLLSLVLTNVQIFRSGGIDSDRSISQIDGLPPRQENNFAEPLSRIKGVFVIKVTYARQACRTICSLTTFLDSSYPIHIFADNNYTSEHLAEIQSYAGKSKVSITVNTERWKRLPEELTPSQREQVRKKCTNFSTPEKARCADGISLSYIYMGYWRYMLMPYEPALQEYEYFISVDADVTFTKRIPDPFAILATNNLTGMFNVHKTQAPPHYLGIQDAANATFSLQERQNVYLDSPRNQFFDNTGQYFDHFRNYPSFWGCFFGGRLDFFQSFRYRKFAKLMIPFTYEFRTDEQAVIGAAWALLDGTRVWSLSHRNISMGIYHQGWVDADQVVNSSMVPPNASQRSKQTHNSTVYWLNHLESWDTFERVNPPKMLLVEEYIATLDYSHRRTWEERCLCARPKVIFVLRKACPNFKAMDLD